MEIVDFLPKYPELQNVSFSPYDENFYQAIFRKKEFNENRLTGDETFPKQIGMSTKYQKTIARYLSSHTPYNSLLVIHAPGSGKTCSAISAIELIKSEKSTINGALVLASSERLIVNFQNEIANKCTAGDYLTDDYLSANTDRKRTIRLNKAVSTFYAFDTFRKLAKAYKERPEAIAEKYSNKIIVIDEVHNIRIQSEEKDSKETYHLIHEFLHAVKNVKILCLSATPMKDGISEIASVMNLITPMDKQLPTGKEFDQEFLVEKKDVLVVRKDKVNKLKEIFKGRISFLKEEIAPDVKKVFLGSKEESQELGLKFLQVKAVRMSPFQTNSYQKALALDTDTKKSGIFNNSIEASLFVYPDGTWGDEGYKKYRTVSKTMLGENIDSFSFFNEQRASVITDDEMLQRIEKLSSLYATVIRNIINTKGKCFVFCTVLRGSGAKVFNYLLSLLGIKSVVVSSESHTKKELDDLIKKFNSPKNFQGKNIKVIIGTKVLGEGYSFSDIKFEAILTPHWNYTETFQALARGIRLGSHNYLKQADAVWAEDPKINILQIVNLPEKDSNTKFSILLHMYKTSEDKDISIKNMLRILIESAMDCSLNYLRNHVNEATYNNQPECEYLSCNYKCDGIKEELYNGVVDSLEEEIDYSTYNLYYLDVYTKKIFQRIETLFRKFEQISLKNIIDNLSDEFSEIQISIALKQLTEGEMGTPVDKDKILLFRDFKNTYMQDDLLYKLIYIIEQIFLTTFKTTFDSIYSSVEKYKMADVSEFTILTSVNKMINDQILLKNKYGISCYLKESEGSYFLIESFEENVNNILQLSFAEYYTKNINICVDPSFSKSIKSLSVSILLDNLTRLCSVEEKFTEIVKLIPLDIQEDIIETVLFQKKKGEYKNEDFVKNVESYYGSFIRDNGKKVFSSLLEGTKNIIRVMDYSPQILRWRDASRLEKIEYVAFDAEKEEILKKSPYRVYGAYNPTTDAFCIIDNSDLDPDTEVRDARKKKTGTNCATCKIPYLEDLIIKVLKIPPSANYGETVTANSKKSAESYFGKTPYNDDDVLRMQYWKSIGTKSSLCNAIKKFLRSKGLVDEQNKKCGVSLAKTKLEAPLAGGKSNEYKFVFKTLSPKELVSDSSLFGTVLASLNSMFNISDIAEDNSTWYIVGTQASKSFTPLMFLNVLEERTTKGRESYIRYFTVPIITENNKKKMISAVEFLFANIPPEIEPVIKLEKSSRRYKSLLDLYGKLNAKTIREDDTFRYITFVQE